jgi:ATP-dependent Lon protease
MRTIMSLIEKKLLDKEPELKTVCDTMHAIEFWVLDDVEIVKEKLENIIPLLNDNLEKYGIKSFLLSSEISGDILTICSYVKTSYFYVFMAFLNNHLPRVLVHYAMEMSNKKDKYSLLIDRLQVLKDLNLLSTIFLPAKICLINGLLKEKHKETDSVSINEDNALTMMRVMHYPSVTAPEEQSPEWLVEKIEALINKIENFEMIVEKKEEIESDDDTPINAFDEMKTRFQVEVDAFDELRVRVQSEALGSLADEYDEEYEDEEDEISICVSSEIEDSLNEDDNASEYLKTVEQRLIELKKLKNEVSDDDEEYEEYEETDEGEEEEIIIFDTPTIELPVNYEWVTQKAIENVDYADYIEETAKKIKKIIKSIKREKPGLKVQDFSIFEELNEKCSNFKQVTDFYHGSFLLNQSKASDSEHVVPMPVLIIGDPGIGKTYYSKLLAKLLNTTSYFIDANSITASWVLSGNSAGWSNAKPGLIFKHLNECETVSPIIIFDEMDKLTGQKSYDPFSTFHQLLEKENATNFVDEFIDLEFDASHILYILSANNLESIPESLLSRMKVFHIQRPSFKDSMKIAQSLYQKLLGKSPIFTEELSQENCAMLAQYTPREMKQILMDSLYTHVTRVSGTTNNNLELRLLPQSSGSEKQVENEDSVINLTQDTNKNKGYLH